MAKRKYPSELNTRTVRVNIGDWHLLLELARQHDTTVAKVLHLAITDRVRQDELVKVIPQAQIPLAIHIPLVGVEPKSKFVTNGNKAAAFRIKSKGVRYE